MHERSKTNPFHWSADILSAVRGHPARPPSILFRKPLPLRIKMAHLKRPSQQSFHIDFFTNRLTGRCRLALLNKVTPAKFFGGKSNRPGNFVQMTLKCKDTLRRAESAKCSLRRNIRRHRGALDANIRAEIGTGGVNRAAREHHRRKRAIRAAIN